MVQKDTENFMMGKQRGNLKENDNRINTCTQKQEKINENLYSYNDEGLENTKSLEKRRGILWTTERGEGSKSFSDELV